MTDTPLILVKEKQLLYHTCRWNIQRDINTPSPYTKEELKRAKILRCWLGWQYVCAPNYKDSDLCTWLPPSLLNVT